MKILIPIKRVVDPYAKIRINSDQTGIETSNVKMAINPFDEIAIEEALKLKEANIAEEVVLVSIGEDVCQEQLRTGLALGADRAILVTQNPRLEPLNIAKLLVKIIEKENPGLVLMGKQAIDGDHNQTGQMLAALLDWPQATYASSIAIANQQATVQREIDGGLETINVNLPAVITTDLRLNVPRYASLPNIMKAKQKPLDVINGDDLGVVFKQHIKRVSVTEPKARTAGIKVADVTELVGKLREEKVI